MLQTATRLKKSQKKKVLVIDDEQEFCQLVKQGLEMLGPFEVSTCSSAVQAISTVRAIEPDLIFLDIQMPEISGDEIASLLKADEELKEIDVVFLTGIVTENELSSVGNLIGGKYYFSKPVKLKDLAQFAKKLCGLN